jgi:putative acetyltransferase
MTAPWILRPIRLQDDQSIAQIIHSVMTEFGCEGAGFAIHDTEVDSMSRHYQASDSAYYVVTQAGKVYGGAGFARLQGTSSDEAVCELRKMYYLTATRGLGLGRAMIELVLDEMRNAGYRRCYLETTSWMDRAQNLYRHAGFSEQVDPEGQTGHHGCDTFFSRQL